MIGGLTGGVGGGAGHAIGGKIMGTLTHNPGAETVAMGRSMKFRIEPYAEANGFGYYDGTPALLRNSLQRAPNVQETVDLWFNKKWINYQMMEGISIVDIGAPDPALRPNGVPPSEPSAFYNMERGQVAGYDGYRTDPQPAWDLHP